MQCTPFHTFNSVHLDAEFSVVDLLRHFSLTWIIGHASRQRNVFVLLNKVLIQSFDNEEESNLHSSIYILVSVLPVGAGESSTAVISHREEEQPPERK